MVLLFDSGGVQIIMLYGMVCNHRSRESKHLVVVASFPFINRIESLGVEMSLDVKEDCSRMYLEVRNVAAPPYFSPVACEYSQ